MVDNQKQRSLPAFTVISIFVAFMIVGSALIPLLSVQLEPSKNFNSISIHSYWNDASPQIMESTITTKIEGLLATVKGITKVSSSSGNGYSNVYANIGKNVKINEVKYEVSALIRQLYPSLPLGISYPAVFANTPFGNKSVLSYSINAGGSSAEIQLFIEKTIQPLLAQIKGISKVTIYGLERSNWKLNYDPALLAKYEISIKDISLAINNYFFKSELGKVNVKSSDKSVKETYSYSTLMTNYPDKVSWNKIAIKQWGDRIIFLTDLAKIVYQTSPPKSYHRINGQHTVTMEIVAAKNVNYLVLAKEIKEKINDVRKKIPVEYKITTNYDATDVLKEELDTVIWRSFFALFVLLIFILIISRQIRYFLLILISLVANLLLAFIFYYFFKLEIHLYSLAGITVSLGLIIDNSIVVIDHIRNKKDLRILLAVIGATFTTIGSVCIVFFLSEDQQIRLVDFAWVMIINLSVSLLISLFLVPALLEKFPLRQENFISIIRRKRRIVIWSKFYSHLINYCSRFKKSLILVLILIFGLPIFLLPSRIATNNIWANAYNRTIGTDEYNLKIRPVLNVVLGGLLRLFLERKEHFPYSAVIAGKTKINVAIKMPYGTNLEQINNIVVDFENFLGEFKEIEDFQSRVNNGYASIEISFLREFETGSFPFVLKTQLESMAINTGLAEFVISGVGQGFNNELHKEAANFGIILLGYNYERLLKYAEQVQSLLRENMRIENVTIGSQRDYVGTNSNYEFVFQVDNNDNLLVNYFSSDMINSSLAHFSGNDQYVTNLFVEGKRVPVVASSGQPPASVWKVMNEPVRSDSGSYIRLKEFASIQKQKTPNEILRENQQYQLVVNYDFIGDQALAEVVSMQIMKKIRSVMPIGYSIKQIINNFWSGNEKNLTWAILLTIGIVFIICCVLLNDLLQPLIVISMIPISFIGVFLMAWIFDYHFDEGGYAALIILCGIVVNAALYILNDYNNLRKDYPGKSRKVVFLKSYNSKIIPVLLSMGSMLLSLMPFIFYGEGEAFWYALAMSVTGGLIFSIPAILIFLPLFLIGESKNKMKNKKGFFSVLK